MHVQLRMHPNGRHGGRLVRGRVPVWGLLSATGRRQSAHGRAERRRDRVHGRVDHWPPAGRLVVQRAATAVVPAAGGRHHTIPPERVGRAEHVQPGRHVRRLVRQLERGSDARQPSAATAGGHGGRDTAVHHVVRGRPQPPSAVLRLEDHVQGGLRRRRRAHHGQADVVVICVVVVVVAVLVTRVQVDGLGAEHTQDHAVRSHGAGHHVQTGLRRLRARGVGRLLRQHGAGAHVDGAERPERQDAGGEQLHTSHTVHTEPHTAHGRRPARRSARPVPGPGARPDGHLAVVPAHQQRAVVAVVIAVIVTGPVHVGLDRGRLQVTGLRPVHVPGHQTVHRPPLVAILHAADRRRVHRLLRVHAVHHVHVHVHAPSARSALPRDVHHGQAVHARPRRAHRHRAQLGQRFQAPQQQVLHVHVRVVHRVVPPSHTVVARQTVAEHRRHRETVRQRRVHDHGHLSPPRAAASPAIPAAAAAAKHCFCAGQLDHTGRPLLQHQSPLHGQRHRAHLGQAAGVYLR